MTLFTAKLIFIIVLGIASIFLYLLCLTEEKEVLREKQKKNTLFLLLEYWKYQIAKRHGYYAGEEFARNGFIRCANPGQALKIIKNKEEIFLILEIDRTKLEHQLKYEGFDNENFYPCVYGPINLDAVIKAHTLKPDKNGKFKFPKYPSIELSIDEKLNTLIKSLSAFVFIIGLVSILLY